MTMKFQAPKITDRATFSKMRKEQARLLKFSPRQEDCPYLRIALPLLQKGFIVWSLNPDEPKAGSFCWNSLAYFADEDLHRRIAQECPDANVCIISCRGVGNPIIVDIDDESAATAITAGTLPDTYTVSSNPLKPHRRHLCFTQTEYSVKMLTLEQNGVIRDPSRLVEKVSKSGKMHLVHPNLLDVKGCGNGGLVVAAGSVLPNGKKYVALNDYEWAPIPNWLVDLVLKLRADYDLAMEKLDEEDNNRRAQGEDVPVPYERIYSFLCSRSFSFASNGMITEERETCLTGQCRRECEGGEDFLDEFPDLIPEIARMPKFKGKHPVYKRKLKAPDGVPVSVLPGRVTRQDVLIRARNAFPEYLLVALGWGLLQDACAKEGFELRRDANGMRMVRRLLHGKYRRTGKFWKKVHIRRPFRSEKM